MILGDLDIAALDVVRDGCTLCDACRDEFSCDPGCGASCAPCVEVTTFVLPDSVVPGPLEAVVVNRWGASSPIALTVLDTDTDL